MPRQERDQLPDTGFGWACSAPTSIGYPRQGLGQASEHEGTAQSPPLTPERCEAPVHRQKKKGAFRVGRRLSGEPRRPPCGVAGARKQSRGAILSRKAQRVHSLVSQVRSPFVFSRAGCEEAMASSFTDAP